jgi:hypothetical protein
MKSSMPIACEVISGLTNASKLQMTSRGLKWFGKEEDTEHDDGTAYIRYLRTRE